MIRPLRSRHRLMWILVLVIVAPLAIAGLLKREAMPVVDETVSIDLTLDAVIGEATGIEYRVGETTVSVNPTIPLPAHPDWSLYWAPQGVEGVGSMRYIGPIIDRPRTFDVSVEPPGRLVVYDLLRDTVVESTPVGGGS